MCESTYDGVLLLDRGQRASGVDLGPHGVDVGAGGGEHRRQIGAVLDLAGGGVAVLEQRVVDVEEHVRLRVAHGDRRLQGEQAAVRLGALPDRRLTLGDVGLAEGERQERDVPVGTGRSPAMTWSWAMRAYGQR